MDPQVTRDASLTPTERFQIIARAEVPDYQAPWETGELTTRVAVQTPLAERLKALSSHADKDGRITAEQLDMMGKELCCGYKSILPPGRKIEPITLYNRRYVARDAQIDQETVRRFKRSFAKIFPA